MQLLVNYEETAAIILFCIGFSTMMLHKNLIKKMNTPVKHHAAALRLCISPVTGDTA